MRGVLVVLAPLWGREEDVDEDDCCCCWSLSLMLASCSVSLRLGRRARPCQSVQGVRVQQMATSRIRHWLALSQRAAGSASDRDHHTCGLLDTILRFRALGGEG